MPTHDWTQVEAGVFHDFHVGWLPAIRTALNAGLLPPGYYAMTEQHAANTVADVLTLHASSSSPSDRPLPPDSGGTAVAEAPPRVRKPMVIEPAALTRRRSVAIRHISEHRLVALIEIVSPANKDRRKSISDFTAKVASALDSGIHVLIVDLFPPGRNDPNGMPTAIRQRLAMSDEIADDDADRTPASEPISCASYVAGAKVQAYIEYVAVGYDLPAMPLFIRPDRYVEMPLEATYQTAFEGLSEFWRDVLENKEPKTY